MYFSGDKIVVKDNDKKGLIENTSETEFSVRWENFPDKVFSYKKDECLHYWEPDPSNQCKHELKEYIGFSESYIYCVRCGKK